MGNGENVNNSVRSLLYGIYIERTNIYIYMLSRESRTVGSAATAVKHK